MQPIHQTISIAAVFLLSLSLSGCKGLDKLCKQRFPEQIRDSIVVVEKIVVKDTTIFHFIKGDTVIDTIYITEEMTSAVSTLEVPFATSWVKWENNRLLHELTQKDSILTLHIQDAISSNSTETIKFKEVVRYEKTNELTKFQQFQTTGFWILAVTLIVLIALSRVVNINTIIKWMRKIISKSK